MTTPSGIRCGRCVQACPRHCHRVDREHTIARPDCIGCGACVRVCPVHALEAAGMEISVDTLLKAVLRDRVFYRRSGGGVTLSGGEPLMQPDFTAAFLRALHEAGLHTCMETSGFALAGRAGKGSAGYRICFCLISSSPTRPCTAGRQDSRWNRSSTTLIF